MIVIYLSVQKMNLKRKMLMLRKMMEVLRWKNIWMRIPHIDSLQLQ